MLNQQPDPMSYTRPKIPTQVSLRIDLSYKTKGEGVRRVWEETARARDELKDDEGNEVELEISHVWRELLQQKLDEEVTKLTGGAGFPALDDKKAWAELLATVRESVAKAKNSR